MEKILALDLGTNSIGWAIRNTSKINENQIEKFGVITFKKGVGIDKTGEYSYAAQRTAKRSTRRLYQARKYRLWKTLEVLIKLGYCPLSEDNLNKWRKYDKNEALKNNNAGRVYPVNDLLFESWIKLDFNNDGKPDYSSPYQLRKELCENELDFERIENKYKLGRALYHIAQRRGFKSSRKGADDIKENVNSEDQEIELQYSEEKKKKELKKHFPEYDETKPICFLLANEENKGNRVRLDATQFLVREDYKNEIKTIFKKQTISFNSNLYKGLIETGNNKNDGSIFYKRPLRSQKGLIGKCTLEPNKYRAPISHPSFEFFRAWSFLNNIKYKTNDEWQFLTLELKQKIYDKFFFRKSKAHFLFSEIIEFANKEINAEKYNYNPKTTVSACPVSARLKEIYGDDYINIKIKKEKTDRTNNEYYTIEDIWHILFSFEDQERVEDFARLKLKLSDEHTKNFIKAWNNTPVGYAMLSLNAINKINPFLAKGLIYTEAVLLANIPSIIGKEIWNENESFLVGEISNIIENNRFQKRIVSIVNDLISKHKNLDYNEKFGSNDYILKNSDLNDIETACSESFGDKSWEKFNSEKKNIIKLMVKDCYQAYFKEVGFERKDFNEERYRIIETNSIKFYKADTSFYRMPKLKDTLAEFLSDNFNLTEKQTLKIYHPSEINIYPPAKEDKKDGILKLGTPKTGSFKNPMAMRTLHELRKLMNSFIETNEIETETRIVVEVARDLNDSNKRWAIETWQKRREEENKEFALAINELLNQNNNLKAKEDNNEDIDKLRLWYEQNEKDLEIIPPLVESRKEIKGLDWRSAKKDSYKEIIAQKNQIDKYRLWLEQECACIYTGRIIKLTDLFDENITDFEHTIPRSKSFDNSLANLSVCFSGYNRNIKKNQIPYNLDNYLQNAIINGKEYTAILPRLEKWKEKIKRIEQQIEYWKGKSKKATTKDMKDDAIKQRHLWQMDYEYWKNKVDRFTMKEITSGFKNSQKVDTQLISKYAFHYLKTYFNKVDVQKGSITAEFRKIYGLQITDEKKDRSKHSHHAKDAAVLTLIPIAAKRDEILQNYYEHRERFECFTDTPYKGFKREHITEIDNTILINNISRNQSLTPANKKVRKRGKELLIGGTNKTKYATGDCIRGQLHDETFFGAVKLGIKENGKLMKDSDGKFIQEEKIRFVLRVPLKFKKNENDTGFKTIEEIEKVIVDKDLFNQIKKQVAENGGLKDALEKGICMFNKKGEKVNKIRRIRIFKDVSEPLLIKKQTYLSAHDYKQHYYASNSSNIYYGLYKGIVKGKEKIGYEIINLFDVANLKSLSSNNRNDFFPIKEDIKLHAILESGQKVIFYKNDIQELHEETIQVLSDRLYKIDGFEKDGRIRFKHHLDALSDKELKLLEEKYGKGIYQGFSSLNAEFPWPKLKLSMGNLKMAIENIDFKIKFDGTIDWIL